MKDFMNKTDDDLKREFLANGTNFFGWNSGKNTPNILLGLSESISLLNNNIKEANESSSRLASALNRLTLAAVIVYSLTLAVAIAGLVVNIVK